MGKKFSEQFLRLSQLADSALPIGSASHSFGLESLVAEGVIHTESLEQFFQDYVLETGALEAAFCRAAYQLASNGELPDFIERWLELNIRLSAFKPAREVRSASATLGRRFLQLVISTSENELLIKAYAEAQASGIEIHHCAAFGLVGGGLGFDEELTALAYLQQSLTGLISACQRLLPLGQTRATQILWNLKPVMNE
ncbi:MAG TPA: urease accessory UreF family protein, partial [Blastocatellia bacterium]|nr:urease accessory UreF family protein [Blastocatellia bacterium]